MKTKLTPQEQDEKRAKAEAKKRLAEEKREIKLQELIESTKKILVNTLTGKVKMYDLLFNIGVAERIKYVDRLQKNAEGEIIGGRITSLGFIFKNGFSIKGVDAPIFNLFKEVNFRYIPWRKD